jgi:hypothetical protein
VLIDDQVARGTARPRRGTERRDAEVVPDRPVETTHVDQFVDLVHLRDRVTSHQTPISRGRSSRSAES